MNGQQFLGAVYMATCRTNGKIYIGKSIHGMEWRRKTHQRYARSGTVIFLHALKKYGRDGFDWCELYLSDDDRALMEAETVLVADYLAAGFTLYNMTDGGDGAAGRKATAKMLAAITGPRSEEHKARMRAAQTPEVLRRKAEIMRNRDVSEDTKRKQSAQRIGKKLSPSHCANIGKGRTGLKLPPWTDERRAKYKAAWAARMAAGLGPSEETTRKRSESGKRRSMSPEARAALAERGRLGAAARWKRA
jgi:group I intron endonuclease